MNAWIEPKQFGLSTDEGLQIWRFCMLNNRRICDATHLTNAHGYLPICVTMPIQDGFRWETKSFAEHLTPYNDFVSYQLNMHKRAKRKELIGGLTIYDELKIPLMASDTTDLAGGKVPASSSGAQELDLNKAVRQLKDSPDTSDTAANIDIMDGLMQKTMPTDMARQVAGLERATQYQAAATVQASSRRNVKTTKIMYMQAWVPCQHMQMFNIFQFQEQVEIIDQNGETFNINPAEFREAGLRYVIHPGLRGMDQLAMILHIKDALNALLQSDASQQFDVAEILDYWTSLLGDYTDFRQFKVQSPMDKLPPEQRDFAFQLLQQFNQTAATQGGQGVQQRGAQGAANIAQLTGR